jgi:hypothetical protein
MLTLPIERVQSNIINVDGWVLRISARDRTLGLSDLSSRVGHLMISIKNPRFNRDLIKGFCRFSSRYLQSSYITVVDTPYLHNIQAFCPDPQEAMRKTSNLAKLAQERTRQVEKIIKQFPQASLNFISWKDLSSKVPVWIEHEIKDAFHSGGKFRRALSDECRSIVQNYDLADNKLALEYFLVSEIPTLIYCYYMFHGGIVDFYPGKIGRYLWGIDTGLYEGQVPRISKLARSHQGITYVDFEVMGQPQHSSAIPRKESGQQGATNEGLEMVPPAAAAGP